MAERILFVGWTRIGDAVMSTVALRHLIETRPDARITLIAGTLAEQVLRHTPNVERIIVYRKRSWNRHWLGLLRRTLFTRWDLVVDLRDSAVGWLAPSRRTLRFRKGGDLRVRELATLLGLSDPPWPRIWLSPAEEARAATLVPTGGPVIAVAVSAGRHEKQWPADRFAAVIRALSAADGPLPGARVLLVGGPGEGDLAAPLHAAFGPGVIDPAGREALLTQAACIARCALFLGNDSGLSHVAAALGVPTLAVFGPTDPRQYAPFGPNSAFVGGTTDGPVREIGTVTVAEVERAARALLAPRRRADPAD